MAGKVRVCVRLPAGMVERLRRYAERLTELTGEEWTLSDVIRYAVGAGDLIIESDIDDLERRRLCARRDPEREERCRAWAEAMKRLAG